ncbi:glutathione-regulated potassium-efflux system oxidoreductase KefF [Roseateles koreensis]|uniref:NAD(P)H-dependent oxidoreductase n=1 Tax=Roseateles koreensis TaxID=2987526 RepID=A0ABT5KN87_9BURK|nr:NAD(P)H-dependent oxidoreductase [Roseateles koreensis]MDC8784302.1 NAD(P)H-dependent oxidoreductase [Roseateles koreensis]
MTRITLLLAHPDLAQSRVTQAIVRAVRAAQQAGNTPITLRDLYQLYPDYAIDTAAERQALAEADTLVLLHPLHWYGMPALLKLWVDEVLQFGWAYGPGGQALRGKTLWLVTSAGGSPEAYSASGHHGHALEQFLLPYAQIARLCGMHYHPPRLLYGAHRYSEAELHQHALEFVQQLLNYGQQDARPLPPEIDLDARPALFSPLPMPLFGPLNDEVA